MDEEKQTKVCMKCGEEKGVDEFYKEKDGRLYSPCKKCKGEYRQKNKEKTSEYGCEYRKRNKKKASEYGREYKKRNIEKIKEQDKEYYYKNREKCLLRTYKYTDKKKGRICDLTIEWLKENITGKPCFYCGQNVDVGCDRIDNSNGHIMDNVLPCCTNCNRIRKDDFTVDEMKVIGEAFKIVYQRRINKSGNLPK